MVKVDVLAIDDADVSTAVQFIREHACEGIKVEDVLAVVPLSRRMLEARFKKLLGVTPHQEISRLQIDRLKQLLVETDLSLQHLAPLAGFKHVEYLSVAFKRATAQTPARFRRQHRSG